MEPGGSRGGNFIAWRSRFAVLRHGGWYSILPEDCDDRSLEYPDRTSRGWCPVLSTATVMFDILPPPTRSTGDFTMDTFEGKMKELLPVRKEERWSAYDRAKGACICPSCPSYSICAQGNGEVLFCILGMSFRCIREDRGCTCPQCTVYQELGLSGKDFCMKGSEKDQRWEKGLG
ncbi:MAG TPA: DUF2769 domain-containing protein [Methanoregulaceae archaeon]|nr:DUF2769 domain-containing protein [Methanoregulaceae archaeon]